MRIEMTNAKGVKLLTEGKKCTENIEVVPIMETVTVSFTDCLGTGVTMFCTVLENGVMSGKVFQANTTDVPITVNNVIKNSVVTLAVTNPFESAGEGWYARGEYDYLNPNESYNSVGYVVKGNITIENSH